MYLQQWENEKEPQRCPHQFPHLHGLKTWAKARALAVKRHRENGRPIYIIAEPYGPELACYRGVPGQQPGR